MSAARSASRTGRASACLGVAPSASHCSISARSARAVAKMRSFTWATTFMALATIMPLIGTMYLASNQGVGVTTNTNTGTSATAEPVTMAKKARGTRMRRPGPLSTRRALVQLATPSITASMAKTHAGRWC